jgi:peptidyl-dipeptidase A
MTPRTLPAVLLLSLALSLLSAPAGAVPPPVPPPAAGAPTAAEARKFIERVDQDLKALGVRSSTADWIKNTYITDDTERAAAAANEELLGYSTAAIRAARRFAKVANLDPDTRRKLHLLAVSQSVAAPVDAGRRLELTTIGAKLEGMYGKAKACLKRPQAQGKCLDIEALTPIMSDSRDYDELLDAWTAWRAPARAMRPLYTRYVALANEGARDIGFPDTGALWRSSYDLSAEAFEKDAARLWEEVKPLYEELHCYVRAQLAKKYGADKVKPGAPIPAHLLGNMWAQEWTNIYPLVEPYQGQPSLDVSRGLVARKTTPVEMVKIGERFFTSLGLDPLPQTFWERSMLTKPRDREVVCHASAWDVTMNDDLRIKVCLKPTEEDLVTIHHELGHDYYFHAYYKLPALYQQGANDGFHEAIGDALTLSITPSYLKELGFIDKVPTDDKGLINVQMKDALEKVAFLPFGKLIDEWRWGVYSGRIPPARYNAAWWDLRRKYQGVAAPVARTEEDFDPGAKYHIPANVPYTRYFLARLLQFQFHRALCRHAGHQGPLHTCSIYGNKEAGRRLQAMLALGASKPWPDALEVLTGERQVQASALLDYFAPLRAWLKEKNKGERCGW